ncbi:hypothetical protein BH11ACT8_BH11ACT8_20340 [soil metagenome]
MGLDRDFDRVFDPSTLHRLIDDTDSRSFVLDLVGTYRRMLQPRIERIADRVAAVDVEDALDAARSLRGSSLMIGAFELAGLAARIERALHDLDLPAARAGVAPLSAAAARADEALSEFVSHVGSRS